jgi:hypothetical protein
MSRITVLSEVSKERDAQDILWGEQNHPNGTGGWLSQEQADMARRQCKYAAAHGGTTWRLILDEEVAEAAAEGNDAQRLRRELLQVAAVAVAWVECIDRRGGVIAL